MFLHNNNYIRTNGIFCEINDNVELLGSELLIENSEKEKLITEKYLMILKICLEKLSMLLKEDGKDIMVF